MLTAVSAPDAILTRPGASRQGRAERIAGWALVAPAVILLLLFVLLPTAAVLIFSFANYRLGASAITFAGVQNYTTLLADPLVRASSLNTALYVAIVTPISVGLGLAAALLIEGRGVLRPFYRVAYLLPSASTFIAMATVWEFLMNPSIGLIDQIVTALGGRPVNFLNDPRFALISVAAIGVWELVGFNMILFAAGLAAIPQDLYHAADLDGADRALDRFRLVTWPMLGPTTTFVAVMTTIRALRVFDVVAVITKGNPSGATDVMLYTIFIEAFQYFNIGYAAALVVVFLAVAAPLALLQLRVLDRRTHY